MTDSLYDRLMMRVEMAPSGCWEWRGTTEKFGYGRMYRREGTTRRSLSTHRVSYELHIGPIPSGMCVLHSCDNPPCVNPEHLRLGTRLDNARDREGRGRGASEKRSGERNGRHRLTEAQVRVIRNSTRPLRALAEEFGVGHSTVRAVRTGRTWKGC